MVTEKLAASTSEAMFWEALPDDQVHCYLCAQHCVIQEGRQGVCGVRENRGGKLYTLVYGLAAAGHIDPIEKKPIFHMRPGSRSLSVATPGCNFRCFYCQNWDISQMTKGKEGTISGQILEPAEVVALAKRYGCGSIAYTYTEPTIFYEYAYETARLAHPEGIYNIFVTNGFMTKEPLEAIEPYLDAANVDLKGFRPTTYKKVMGGNLEPVLETLERMKALGIWVEVTTLVIPTVNDSDEELRDIARFVRGLGAETPWHISRFHPDYKMTDIPFTPASTLRRGYEIGREEGLRYVYVGNIPGDETESTLCYTCQAMLIRRYGFQIVENRLKDGHCPDCGTAIDGVWE